MTKLTPAKSITLIALLIAGALLCYFFTGPMPFALIALILFSIVAIVKRQK